MFIIIIGGTGGTNSSNNTYWVFSISPAMLEVL